ncbi:hypothetical protein PDL71_14440 [Lacibacter sp. MH-610]|uniref:hypothetical protein n=1 Tax=Lacibacter sp. MH-610 TaxID=3020883 RepID=UPI00389160BA
MAKMPNLVGGGARTNLNGLQFEGRTDLREAIRQHPIYKLNEKDEVVKDNLVVAQYFEKNGLYKKFLEPKGINYKTVLSKKLLPDGALLVGDTLYIVEKKYQAGAGSVDEKLQTCDFKKKQYQKLFAPLGINVEFYYVLNRWFEQDSNRDVFEYINSVGCKYFIEVLPLDEIGL